MKYLSRPISEPISTKFIFINGTPKVTTSPNVTTNPGPNESVDPLFIGPLQEEFSNESDYILNLATPDSTPVPTGSEAIQKMKTPEASTLPPENNNSPLTQEVIETWKNQLEFGYRLSPEDRESVQILSDKYSKEQIMGSVNPTSEAIAAKKTRLNNIVNDIKTITGEQYSVKVIGRHLRITPNRIVYRANSKNDIPQSIQEDITHLKENPSEYIREPKERARIMGTILAPLKSRLQGNRENFGKALDAYIADHPRAQILNPEEKKEFFDLILSDGKTEKSMQSLQEIMGKLDPTFLDKDNLIGYNSLSTLIQITNDLINLEKIESISKYKNLTITQGPGTISRGFQNSHNVDFSQYSIPDRVDYGAGLDWAKDRLEYGKDLNDAITSVSNFVIATYIDENGTLQNLTVAQMLQEDPAVIAKATEANGGSAHYTKLRRALSSHVVSLEKLSRLKESYEAWENGESQEPRERKQEQLKKVLAKGTRAIQDFNKHTPGLLSQKISAQTKLLQYMQTSGLSSEVYNESVSQTLAAFEKVDERTRKTDTEKMFASIDAYCDAVQTDDVILMAKVSGTKGNMNNLLAAK